jgi:hypothetical protein
MFKFSDCDYIILVIIFIVFSFLLYKINLLQQERFENNPTVDISSIKTLSDISTSLMKGGLTIPGNVAITGASSFGNGTCKINPDGSASFGNGACIINVDGTVSFANGKVTIDGNGFIRTKTGVSIENGRIDLNGQINIGGKLFLYSDTGNIATPGNINTGDLTTGAVNVNNGGKIRGENGNAIHIEVNNNGPLVIPNQLKFANNALLTSYNDRLQMRSSNNGNPGKAGRLTTGGYFDNDRE